MTDDTVIKVLITCLLAYVAVVVFQGVLKVVTWVKTYRARKAVQRGEIPPNYSAGIKSAQEEANSRPDDSGHSALVSIREKVGLIRLEGYLRGETDEADSFPFKYGVAATPYKKGSGEAKQWTRGYCQARNVMAIKKYIDRA